MAIKNEPPNKQTLNYLLKRAVAEVISEDELTRLLKSGKTLRIKEGLDPSAPDIHLGHMVTLRKMRQFQDLGHQIVIIVGDWTAQIGDPSGSSATRPMLSAEQVKENAETYLKQFFKIVDKNKTEVRFQSEWFGKFDLADVVRLTSKFTVAQLLAREDFSKRFNDQKPIAITELLYPLMQAYDSVAIQADVELGGTDQKFNFLVGRELQAMMGQRSQQIFMVPLLVGTDGVQKMSKSLGNYIGIAEPPEIIYGKTMSIRDDYIMTYFELLTDVPEEELEEFKKQMDSGVNPMTLKKRLAREVLGQLYREKEAKAAEEHFEKTVQKKEVPDDISEYAIQHEITLSQLLAQSGLAASRSEAVRLINQGAVTVDNEKKSDANEIVSKGVIIKVGKRRYLKTI
ncbi:MAG: tyrosine--tRNA ligase [Chloroflexi bacterium RBG_13_51_18]|nr:MAG: tyrosine--tRNA ligase [Chloroflexi bacterium RBG_13_51_18]